MVHATKGIVLRTVKYGDTSIISSVYTELFGIQSYMVKGVRQSTKKSAGKGSFFQPGAILNLEVYHNELKQLQFIKEYEWGYLYENVLFDVVKNTVAMFLIELLQHSLKQPEANPELYYLIEDSLKQLDKGSQKLTANLPLYFILHLGSELGFRFHGQHTLQTPLLDLQEGMFVAEKPIHPYYLEDALSSLTFNLLNITFYSDLENIPLNRLTRRTLLVAYLAYLSIHINDFGEMRSLAILQAILE